MEDDQPKPHFEPLEVGQDSSEETEEEFDWYHPEEHDKESYFAFVNLRRRTLKPGE